MLTTIYFLLFCATLSLTSFFNKYYSYDVPSVVENFYERPEVQKYNQYFTHSHLTSEWVNESDNGIIFVEMPLRNPKKVGTSIKKICFLKYFFPFSLFFSHFEDHNII